MSGDEDQKRGKMLQEEFEPAPEQLMANMDKKFNEEEKATLNKNETHGPIGTIKIKCWMN